MSNKKIISIDDDSDFNNLLKVLFKKNGLVIDTYDNAEDFLNAFKASPPNLALIDINLSEKIGAGFQLIKAIRNKYGFEIPIIVLSKRTDKMDISNALEIGATDFVPKPLDDYLLFHKIKTLLADETEGQKLFLVKDSDTHCRVSFNQRIEKVSEFGVTIMGKELISKGTIVNLNGIEIQEIVGVESLRLQVQQTWVKEEDKLFRSYLEFDPDDEKLLSHVRQWVRINCE